MDKKKLLRKLENNWQEFRDSWKDLPSSVFAEPVTKSWTLKDIIGHVTTWEEETLEHVPVILAGKRPGRYSDRYGGVDSFNELKLSEKRKLSLADVLTQSDEVHERLVQFLAACPDEAFEFGSRVIRRIRLDTYGHYRKHTERINSWRKMRQERG